MPEHKKDEPEACPTCGRPYVEAVVEEEAETPGEERGEQRDFMRALTERRKEARR